VAREVVHDLAAAGRVADVDAVAQVEVVDHGGEVVGVVVHVVAVEHLLGAPVPAAVVRDHAIALVQKEHHLRVPVV
jgi:hypothetical protein